MKQYRIALDGGAGTGKSTVSNLLSEQLGVAYISTGLTYRLFGLLAMKYDLVENVEKLIEVIDKANIDYEGDVIVSSEEFDYNALKSPEAGALASKLAANPKIWAKASAIWKKVASREGVLLEGRDIGTQIMPDAENKFFMIVSDEEAARRRVNEHEQRGEEVSYEEILLAIKERNKRDSERETSPLKAADDAVVIDTSGKTPQEVADEIKTHLK